MNIILKKESSKSNIYRIFYSHLKLALKIKFLANVKPCQNWSSGSLKALSYEFYYPIYLF